MRSILKTVERLHINDSFFHNKIHISDTHTYIWAKYSNGMKRPKLHALRLLQRNGIMEHQQTKRKRKKKSTTSVVTCYLTINNYA